MIEVRRSGELYFATISPPHGGPWENASGLARDDLVKTLQEQGTHLTDAWDAVLEAERLPSNAGKLP